MGVFAVHDAGIKWMVADIPVWQVLFFSGARQSWFCAWRSGARRVCWKRAAATIAEATAGVFAGVINLAAWLCYYSAAPLAATGAIAVSVFSRRR